MQRVFRIKMVWDRTIDTTLGCESRYIVTYSDGTVRARWFIVHCAFPYAFTL